MATLTPNDLLNLVTASAKASARITAADGKVSIRQSGLLGPDSMVSGVKLSGTFRNGHVSSQDITTAQWLDRLVQAAAILHAESGGVTDARCYNVVGADGSVKCKPRPPVPSPRGTDRGIAQWNDKAWPEITDTAADNPQSATILMCLVSDAYSTFGPWSKSKGMDKGSDSYKLIRLTMDAQLGTAKDLGVFGLPGEAVVLDAAQSVYSSAAGALGAVLDWTEALGKLLSTLISGTFWRRVGLGALGLLLIGVALAMFGGPSIAPIIGKVL